MSTDDVIRQFNGGQNIFGRPSVETLVIEIESLRVALAQEIAEHKHTLVGAVGCEQTRDRLIAEVNALERPMSCGHPEQYAYGQDDTRFCVVCQCKNQQEQIYMLKGQNYGWGR